MVRVFRYRGNKHMAGGPPQPKIVKRDRYEKVHNFWPCEGYYMYQVLENSIQGQRNSGVNKYGISAFQTRRTFSASSQKQYTPWVHTYPTGV